MSNYSRVHDFSVKDALPTGNANKVIKGSEIDAEFDAIVSSVSTKSDSVGSEVSTPSSSGGSLTIDFQAGDIADITLTEDTAISFTNVSANGTGSYVTIILTQDGTGGHAVSFSDTVSWPSGTSPSFSTGANDVDIIVLFTIDGGTTYFGFDAGLDMG